MSLRLVATNITTTSNGAAITPFITATKTNSRIGLTFKRLNTVPPIVPTPTKMQNNAAFLMVRENPQSWPSKPDSPTEPDAASTGTARRPLPMKPKAKMMLENFPANGLSEFAACAAL